MDFTAVLQLHKSQPAQVPVYNAAGEAAGTITLPPFFTSPLRQDIVHKAFLHLSTHRLQPKGASKLSGHKHSVESWGPGFGMARISRVKGRGTPKYGAGGMVPSAVGGRPTHPPVPEKKIHKSLNKKELRNAMLAALAFTSSVEHVRKRGHRVPDGVQLPIVVEDDFESVSKTRDFKMFFSKLGLEEELNRCMKVKMRAGRGKMRGRRYKKRRGPLIVVSKKCSLVKAAENVPGVDVVEARNLSVLDLAPGGHPGRLTIFTKPSLEVLGGRLR
ncbi:MAG: 50S ribosomal protein L4 [Candidatus Caldarchaeum sp.]|uniref:Large ribosomal subunit protein uL4 n=1 Tax=Caldiarchaeum subterraneum TaxID=311458 RepID=A0A7C5LC95_CALS0